MGAKPFSEAESTAIRRFIMSYPSGTFEVIYLFFSMILSNTNNFRISIKSVEYKIGVVFFYFRCI